MSHNSRMRKPRRTYRQTQIRAWRKFRGLSLDRLAERMTDATTGESLLTPTSISRIERGLQPYSQETLEALSDALGCSPADLLVRNPNDPEAPWSLWDTLKPAEKRATIEVIKAIKEGSKAA